MAYSASPGKCDTCHAPIEGEFYDARIPGSSWGNLCPSCFRRFGCSLGTGRGQHYRQNPATGAFDKIAG
jgi:hypothetical protein